MCGIVGYIGSNKAQPVLLDGLGRLEYRGYDSAGIAVNNGNGIKISKSKGKLKSLEDILEKKPLEGSIGIGHTRWATHGAPSDSNSHPQSSPGDLIAVVHNGIIENYMEIKEELIKKGYSFKSDTDTETISLLIHDYYKNDMSIYDAIYSMIQKVKGAYALGILCSDYPDTIFAVRQGSPLIVGIGENENFIASDIPAILHHTRKIYFIDEKEIAVIKQNEIKIYDNNKKEVNKDIFNVTWDIKSAEKEGYDHFMIKEIHEQPRIVKDILSQRVSGNAVIFDDINLSKEYIENIDRIYIVACGTAYHAGLIGKYLIEKTSRIPVVADMASEFRYKDPILDDKTLVIVISQSGETADTLEALRIAKRSNSRVLAFVNAVGSSIARDADDVFYILAGPEIAVASTKAFSAQVTAMYLLACHIAMATEHMSEGEFSVIKEELELLSSKIEYILNDEIYVKNLADKYITSKNVFFIGRGLDYLVSMEGSLKLKEIAYLHSEAYAAGELKHGPIAMIEDTTLVIALATQDDLFEKTVSNIKEVKARGAKVLALAPEGNNRIADIVDDVIYIPATHWMISPLIANISMQLFAYYMALGLGTDIDKPRNLAKSVTVE